MTTDAAYVPEMENPWPTFEDAMATASAVAGHAFDLYGDLLDSVWMYGSRARGDNLPDSDLDLLLVKTSKEADPRGHIFDKLYLSLIHEHLGHELTVLLSLHTGYREQLDSWDTMFYRNVRADMVRVR